jgi:phosphoribosyl-AMP cyclohydrolase
LARLFELHRRGATPRDGKRLFMSDTTMFPDPAGRTKADIEAGSELLPKFDGDGLVGAIVTDEAGAVLMFAWMNAEALARSLETGVAHFWSRSRNRLWVKGEESGNRLTIREARIDCDQDAVWLKVAVEGAGVACHTGAKTCFYRAIVPGDGGGFRLVKS